MNILKEQKYDGIYLKHAVTDFPNDNKFPMHVHDNFEIYYFVKGSVEYLVEGASYILKHGDLLLIRPSEAHKPKILESVKYERYNINFPASILDNIDPERRLLKPFSSRPLGAKNLYSSYEFGELPIEKILHDLCYGENDIYEKKLKTITFLIKLLDAANTVYNKINVVKNISNNRDSEIVAYVNTHIAESFSVPQIAKHFYLSASQFNRIFKNATGAAPWTYITIKRLTNAKEKIQNGMSAHDAAASCGFNDYSVFYRAYLKHFGCAPTKV